MISRFKIGQVILKNNLTYKAPLLDYRSNRFWKDLKIMLNLLKIGCVFKK